MITQFLEFSESIYRDCLLIFSFGFVVNQENSGEVVCYHPRLIAHLPQQQVIIEKRRMQGPGRQGIVSIFLETSFINLLSFHMDMVILNFTDIIQNTTFPILGLASIINKERREVHNVVVE